MTDLFSIELKYYIFLIKNVKKNVFYLKKMKNGLYYMNFR